MKWWMRGMVMVATNLATNLATMMIQIESLLHGDLSGIYLKCSCTRIRNEL
jgi:hypothetical protein